MKTLLLAIVMILASVAARADNCLSFTADPATYIAAPGGSWTVDTTFVNCGTDYLVIGSGFGSDESPYATENFYDPSFILGPGDSKSVAFGYYTWVPDAPEGYTWDVRIDSFYGFLAAPCNGISVPCVWVGQPGTAWASFTAQVDPPSEVPEPGTLILLGTGLAGIITKLRRGGRRHG